LGPGMRGDGPLKVGTGVTGRREVAGRSLVAGGRCLARAFY
jgi:hypothetical protein